MDGWIPGLHDPHFTLSLGSFFRQFICTKKLEKSLFYLSSSDRRRRPRGSFESSCSGSSQMEFIHVLVYMSKVNGNFNFSSISINFFTEITKSFAILMLLLQTPEI